MLSKMSDYIDVIVPRGGKNLVEKVQNGFNLTEKRDKLIKIQMI